MVDEEVPAGVCVGDQTIETMVKLKLYKARHDLRTHSEDCTERQPLIVLAAVRIRHHLWRRSLRLKFATPTSSTSVSLVLFGKFVVCAGG